MRALKGLGKREMGGCSRFFIFYLLQGKVWESMYQALYRKWRPKVFLDVLGQAHITGTLENQITNSKLSHAYLFSGTRGTGKTSTAKILARAVNCENPVNGNPCNECYACKSALSGSAVDIIEMDAASNNKVEDARMIRDEVIYTPAEFKYKVYIIDEAHMLTQNAFNALLKTLEEPPAHIIFIFATTEPHKFPATILSRCQRFDFKRIMPSDIVKRIKYILSHEGCEITDEAVNLVVRVADGSMRDALSLLDQCVALGGKNITASDVAEIAGVSDPQFIYDFADSIIKNDTASAMRYVKKAYEKGFDLETAADELLSCFRNIMIARTLNKKEDVVDILEISEAEAEVYSRMAGELSLERILRYIDMLESSLNSRMFVGNPRLSLEIALAGMLKKPDVTEPQGVLEKMMELENRVRKLESGKVVFKSEPAEEIKADAPAIKEEAVSAEVVSEETIQDEDVPYVYEAEDFGAEENPDYVIQEETFVPEEIPAMESGNLKELWGDVLILASKNSLAGFDLIIGSTKAEFFERSVELFFDNESFFKIAQTNKFDENIHKAYETVGEAGVTVKLKYGKAPEKKEDNFKVLLDKIKGESNVEYL